MGECGGDAGKLLKVVEMVRAVCEMDPTLVNMGFAREVRGDISERRTREGVPGSTPQLFMALALCPS